MHTSHTNIEQHFRNAWVDLLDILSDKCDDKSDKLDQIDITMQKYVK